MTNNHINIVVLGNFNPSILTHHFLVDECGFDLGSTPSEQIPRIPVVSSIEYDNLHFFADLGRFQITEKNSTNPKQSKLPKYVDTYLKKLPYTPIKKCGMNFSYMITIKSEELDKIEMQLMSNRKSLCESLEMDNFQLQVFFDISAEKEQLKKWILQLAPQGHNTKTILSVSYTPDANTLGIDFNYEVDLVENYDLIKNIVDGYDEVYDLFLAQLQKLFGRKIL